MCGQPGEKGKRAGESSGRRRGHFLPSPEGGQCILLIKFQG